MRVSFRLISSEVHLPHPVRKSGRTILSQIPWWQTVTQCLLAGRISVLGSQRVKPMAKTFNDVEGLKKLLEEREKDLELAAKIGKTLLDKNRDLQQTNEMLEQELTLATDKVTQLKHDLQQKVNLLHSVTDAESDFYYSSNKRDRIHNLKGLQKKLAAVEEENVHLKTEANHLKALTKDLEEKEQQLVADCVKQLADSNKQRSELSSRLNQQTEICTAQQQHIQFLLKEILVHEENEAKLNLDNEEMRSCLFAAREAQSELSQELLDLKERYAEITDLLHEAHEEIDGFRSSDLQRYCWPGVGVPGLPGSEDLEYAIRRISLRQKFEREYRKYLQVSTMSHFLRSGPSCSDASPCYCLPTTSTCGLSDLLNDDDFRSWTVTGSLHKKSNIELVKRFHGSAVLSRWKKLATPSFDKILERQPPGIHTQLNALLDPPISAAAVKYLVHASGDVDDLTTAVYFLNESSAKNTLTFVTSDVPVSLHRNEATSTPIKDAGLNLVNRDWLSWQLAKPAITTTTWTNRTSPCCLFSKFKSKQKWCDFLRRRSSSLDDDVSRDCSLDSEALDNELPVVTKTQLFQSRSINCSVEEKIQ